MLRYRYFFAIFASLSFYNNFASAKTGNPFLNNNNIYLSQTSSNGNPYITNNVSLDTIKSKANHGDANAQLTLGLLYSLGKRVPVDHKKELYWYQKAADQGNANAQLMLALSYKDGIIIS